MALRLSGQLLLGITRIYHKKVTLLLEDGQAAMQKLKDFFKPGQVDMTEVPDSAASVTLPDDGFGDDLQQFNDKHFQVR